MTDYFAKSPTTPDLSSVNLMACTPCGDGRYEKSYMDSLFNTFKEIDRLGGKAQHSQFPYCADLSLARAKLLGTFYRSNCTHLLWVDSDMGWRPQDVVRLIIYDRDFVGAAGPKKRYPISFAANMTDDNGKPKAVLQESSGAIEVSEVGMAFVLLTKACVTRLWDAHPELEFNSDDNKVERALFEPMIQNRRRLSEDFAFCRRWREIGGRVLLLPDIALSHTGSHTFTGALEDTFDDGGMTLRNMRVISSPMVDFGKAVGH